MKTKEELQRYLSLRKKYLRILENKKTMRDIAIGVKAEIGLLKMILDKNELLEINDEIPAQGKTIEVAKDYRYYMIYNESSKDKDAFQWVDGVDFKRLRVKITKAYFDSWTADVEPLDPIPDWFEYSELTFKKVNMYNLYAVAKESIYEQSN